MNFTEGARMESLRDILKSSRMNPGSNSKWNFWRICRRNGECNCWIVCRKKSPEGTMERIYKRTSEILS